MVETGILIKHRRVFFFFFKLSLKEIAYLNGENLLIFHPFFSLDRVTIYYINSESVIVTLKILAV